MRLNRIAILFAAAFTAFAVPANAANYAVGPQYDTTHVYVAPADFDRFIASLVATFGGSMTKQGVFQMTPTPSQSMSQLALTPVGTISVFGFKTPIPHPFGDERTGYLVNDFDAAVKAARDAGAEVVVAPFPDPVGRDAVVSWPGGVNMQLYWHTTPPAYPALATIPENRIYISPDRADSFVHDFLAFANGKVVSDDAKAPGTEIGRPGETYRRVRVQTPFGKLALMVTDGHLPFPYGHEMTGYEVPNLGATLAKATKAGAVVLTTPTTSGGRTAAMVQFPGGYIAEIHSGSPYVPRTLSAPVTSLGPVGPADVQHWAVAWNSHDIGAVMSLFTPDVVIHQPSNPKPLDAAGVRGFFSMIFKAYPDFHVDVTQAVVDGTKAVSIERVTGTWSGPYTDPATGVTTPGNGHKFDHPGVMVLTYQPDHRISGVDIYWDRLTVDQQLGVKP